MMKRESPINAGLSGGGGGVEVILKMNIRSADFVKERELTIDELIEMHEQDIEELESSDPVQSDGLTVGNLTEGLSSIEQVIDKKKFNSIPTSLEKRTGAIYCS
ncbi:hypothetical protein TNCV_2212651 [Trichonephila clavipes]|nr:hypothetical protein TNCV_2212651 [Trichonephila clavipes]